ncbi:MAG: NUDIX domain-containing protein [Patescibacteria group bacterium]
MNDTVQAQLAKEEVGSKKIRCAGGVVVNTLTSKVLLVKNAETGAWGIPKGKRKGKGTKREESLLAAVREIGEETGVTDLVVWRLLGSYSRPKDRTRKVIEVFLFYTKQEELIATDPRHQEIGWFTKEEAVCFITLAEDRQFFAEHQHAF